MHESFWNIRLHSFGQRSKVFTGRYIGLMLGIATYYLGNISSIAIADNMDFWNAYAILL